MELILPYNKTSTLCDQIVEDPELLVDVAPVARAVLAVNFNGPQELWSALCFFCILSSKILFATAAGRSHPMVRDGTSVITNVLEPKWLTGISAASHVKRNIKVAYSFQRKCAKNKSRYKIKVLIFSIEIV